MIFALETRVTHVCLSAQNNGNNLTVVHLWIRYLYTGCTLKNGAFSKVKKKFIYPLTRAQRTPSAAVTVQVSHALPVVRFSCLLRGQFPRWRRSRTRLSVCSVLRCPDLWLQCSVSFVHSLEQTLYVQHVRSVHHPIRWWCGRWVTDGLGAPALSNQQLDSSLQPSGQGRTVTQAVSRRSGIAETRVRSQVNPCEICGGRNGTPTGLCRSGLVYPVGMIAPCSAVTYAV
jgi:hypothetical protein